MSRRAACICILGMLLAGIFQPRALAAPPNDDYADAITIESFSYTVDGDIRGATRQAGEPVGGFSDAGTETAWWSFTPSEPGVFSARVDAPTWNRHLILYRGASLAALQSIASDNVRAITQPGEQYWLQLTTAAPSEGGTFTLRATFTPNPTNDNFADAAHMEGQSHVISSWMLGPTIEPGEPLQTNTVAGTLWWSWTAPMDGRAVITPTWITLGTNYLASKIEVYSGPTLDRLEKVGYRVWADREVIFAATAGSVYYIQVWAREDNNFEEVGFGIELFPFGPAINDNFADALEIQRAGWSTPRSTIGATREPGEPRHRDGDPGKSLWWKFQAAINTRSMFVRPGLGTLTNFTTAVYRGDSVDTLRLVAKGVGLIEFEAWAIETYYFAVEVPVEDDGDVAIEFYEGEPSIFTHEIPGNLVTNPSFETLGGQVFSGWSGLFGGGIINNGGPDGRNFAFLGADAVWQDIATIPDESYRLQFVYVNGQAFNSRFTAKFGGDLTTFSLPWTNQAWHVADLVFRATNAVTRLEFKGGLYTIGLDQVSVRRLNNPISLGFAFVEQREDRTIVWQLTGGADFRCIIERQTDDGAWQPVQTLESQSGAVTFTDAIDPTAKVQIYRALLLN